MPYIRMIVLGFCSCALLAFPAKSLAQEDAEFRMEIGGGIGTSFYLGDVNDKMYSKTCPAITALWRYLFDHHNVLKVQLTTGGIKGQGDAHADFLPDNTPAGTIAQPYIHSFSGAVTDLSCIYELNFWPYGYYSGYMGYKRLTPFLQLGAGFTYGSSGKAFSANIPLGLGIKYRLGKRLNLAFDWAMHFSLSDQLDNLKDPKGITSEAFKNKDSYCTTMITLTYSFAPICPNCNKAY